MPIDYGKKFEERVREDFKKSFPNGLIYRLPDQMSGYKEVSQNPCDFIGYNLPYFFMLEAKSHKGASIPFDAIPQHERLERFIGIQGVRCGIILWLYEKDIVYYIPASTITKMKKDGKKSVGIKAVEEGYNIKIIPSTKLRVFMESDYTFLMELKDGE